MKGRSLLMIPGPIEFEPEVLRALGAPTTSHVAPNFIETFGNSLELMRTVWMAPTGQPFIISGSGTLAMDLAGANLIQPGDKALVVSTGYFGERYANLLSRYGAQVTIVSAEMGHVVGIDEIETVLKADQYKLLTFTHVDTSTGVRMDPQAIGALGKKYGVLTVLDGVCSVAGEEIRQEEWGLDVVLTASQKAIGVPPGLALLVASQAAMKAFHSRSTPVSNYYGDWSNWLPIMEAYEARKPSYFATPPVNHVAALEVSLEMIAAEGMEARFARHKEFADTFRSAVKGWDMSIVPREESNSANTLTAVYYPEDLDGNDFRMKVVKAGVIIAGGLLKGKPGYFRVGHMGAVNRNDIHATITAIDHALKQCRS